jgi:hypothetical protein
MAYDFLAFKLASKEGLVATFSIKYRNLILMHIVQYNISMPIALKIKRHALQGHILFKQHA